ncbi:MAG TPA: alpha-L-fucosidase [Propionibacteriaceae bacterium]|nr:alpha-L-fucosidase [Propionibacteriaceae bacterium]HQE32414.1 alpha-L-fucosidase [Propionibacteriaceae bacterium]
MITFDGRTGPAEAAPASAYPSPGAPRWFRDAKLGFFLHWGIYSVPAWAVAGSTSTYTEHAYAEWYGNTVRIDGSSTSRLHESRYGVGTSYEDLADHWLADEFDADAVIAALARAGGRYVVPTTKHHDGFCLWDTTTTPFNAARRGPRRDLVAELHQATIGAGLRFGVYYSGALDWHVSDFPPITNDDELFSFRRNDEAYARYAGEQLGELIERFEPALLWNDIEWPDEGKGVESYGVAALLQRHRDLVPDGIANDRWGVPYHGFLTREYLEPQAWGEPWEATRGLGRSFGHNLAEPESDLLSVGDLVGLLVDVVAKGGNLLLNVGLSASGRVPEEQLVRLEGLAEWMSTNGEAIHSTEPWAGSPPDGRLRLTCRPGATYVHMMSTTAPVPLPRGLVGRPYRWLGSTEELSSAPSEIVAPPGATTVPVAVFS